MDILIGDFKGVRVTPESTERIDSVEISFGIDWDNSYKSERLSVLHAHNNNGPQMLLQGIAADLVESSLPALAKLMATDQTDMALSETAFIYGGSQQADQLEHEQEDDFVDPHDDPEYSFSAQEQTNQGSLFHTVQLPMVSIDFAVPGASGSLNAQAMVDSGSSLNLISQATAKLLIAQHSGLFSAAIITCTPEDLPRVTVASGTQVKALGCVELQLKLPQLSAPTPKQQFFIFPNLPVQAIIGHALNEAWGATLDWRTRTWAVQPDASTERVTVPWVSTAPHWRGPVRILASRDTVLPPMSHSKIEVDRQSDAFYKKNGLRGSFGLISPLRDSQTIRVAYGVANNPTWVQVANLTSATITLRKGSHVADLNPREEWDIASADVDPNLDDLKREYMARRTALEAKLLHEERRRHSATNEAENWYRSVTATSTEGPIDHSSSAPSAQAHGSSAQGAFNAGVRLGRAHPDRAGHRELGEDLLPNPVLVCQSTSGPPSLQRQSGGSCPSELPNPVADCFMRTGGAPSLAQPVAGRMRVKTMAVARVDFEDLTESACSPRHAPEASFQMANTHPLRTGRQCHDSQWHDDTRPQTGYYCLAWLGHRETTILCTEHRGAAI